MDQGKIIAYGTHDELIRLVGEQTRIDLTLNAEPERVLALWQELEGVSRVLPGEERTATILVDDSNRVLPRLFEAATGVGVRITGVDIQEPNLETVFLHLTGRALRD